MSKCRFENGLQWREKKGTKKKKSETLKTKHQHRIKFHGIRRMGAHEFVQLALAIYAKQRYLLLCYKFTRDRERECRKKIHITYAWMVFKDERNHLTLSDNVCSIA